MNHISVFKIVILLNLVFFAACKKSDPFSNNKSATPEKKTEEIVNLQTEETWATKFPSLWSKTAFAESSVDPKSVTYEQLVNDLATRLAAKPELKGPKGDKGDVGSTGATGPTGPKGDKGESGPSYTPWFDVFRLSCNKLNPSKTAHLCRRGEADFAFEYMFWTSNENSEKLKNLSTHFKSCEYRGSRYLPTEHGGQLMFPKHISLRDNGLPYKMSFKSASVSGVSQGGVMTKYGDSIYEHNFHFEVDKDLSDFNKAYFTYWYPYLQEDRMTRTFPSNLSNWSVQLRIQARCIIK